MPESSDNPMEALNAAVAWKAPITVVRTDGSGETVTGQFVALAKPTEPGAIWARPAVKYAATTKLWAARQACVSVRFAVGLVRAGVEAVIEKQIRDYWLTDRLPISAFLLQRPTKIWVEQREHARYQLRNDGGGIRATLARTDRDRKARLTGPENRAALWDIGKGGAGFICPFNRALIQTAPNACFEVAIDVKGQRAVLPGVCAYARATGNLVRIGIKFDLALATPEANLLLQQLIIELEKREGEWKLRSA
jgi:hypothetical protein